MRARPVSLRPRRPRLRTVLIATVLVVLLTAGWFWLRDSSLVTVKTVTVTGITGAQADDVTAALEEAGRSMTTLHLRQDALETAVAPFSIVKRIEVTSDFPNKLRVHVVTNVAVGAVVVDERAIPVTADGTLLRDVTAREELPTVPLRTTPGGDRLTEGFALRAFAALGAAPAALRARVEEVGSSPEHGLELQLADGPQVWFGDDDRTAAKWAATAAVLADPEAMGATYIDVTAPGRPAVGGLPDGAPAVSETDEPDLPEGVVLDPETGAAVDPDGVTGEPDPYAASPDDTVESTP